jgi:DNA-directed RNA polymerase specialized sigma24 family protein
VTTQAVADDTDALVRDAVRMFRGLAGKHPDLDDDDLFQECRMHVDAQRHGFRYGRWSTWVYSVVRNKIIDLGRSHGRRKNRDTKYAEGAGRQYADAGEEGQRRVPVVYPVEVLDPPPAVDTVDGEIVADSTTGPTLTEWLHTVYIAARRACVEPRHTQGRRHFTAAQQYAVGLLHHRLGSSTRCTVQTLSDRADLRRVLGLDRLPSHKWVWQGEVVTRKIYAASASPAA